MTLDDLLSELRENILYDRTAEVAGDTSYLWSTATLIRYIDEAQRRFARQALVIRDSVTREVCEVELVEGQTNYTLHESVRAVVSAKFDGDSYDLARAGHTAFDDYRPPDQNNWDMSMLLSQTPGKPRAYATDEQAALDDNDSSGVVSMRIYPAPSAAYAGDIIRLRVIRMPIERLAANNLQAIPEVPEDHHLEMLDWAAYLALRIVDHEGGNPARALEFRASFEAHVKEARKSVLRKMFVPQSWGFGRNGWSW